jgi:hypothetical protein
LSRDTSAFHAYINAILNRLRSTHMRVLLLTLIFALTSLSVQAGGPFVSGKEIKVRVAGSELKLKSSADYEFPVDMTLRADGSMDGVSHNGYIDIGRWWVRADILCHKWDSWFDGLRKCYAVAESDAGLTLVKPTAKHFKNAKTRLK